MNQSVSILHFFDDGGWVMWALLALSIAALASTFERAWSLHRERLVTGPFLSELRRRLLGSRSTREALALCRASRSPLATVLGAAIAQIGKPRERVAEALESAAELELDRRRIRLTLLSTIAGVAPLLGFFGTVTGMMASFQALVDAGMSNPGLVAQGIKEALATTAGGLAVAIPAQLATNFFAGRVELLRQQLQIGALALADVLDEIESRG